MRIGDEGCTVGYIKILTTHDVVFRTPQVWSGKANCKNGHSRTCATARASQSVRCSVQPSPRAEWSLWPTFKILFTNSTMLWLIMAIAGDCSTANTLSLSCSKNRT